MLQRPVTVRTEVLEYGGLPISPWLSHLDSLVAFRDLKQHLLRQGNFDHQGRCFVSREAISAALDANAQQTEVLLDLLAAVVDDPGAVQAAPEDGSPLAADAYRLVLYLFVHFYTREAGRPETAESWPSEHPSNLQVEPSSPMRLYSNAWARDQPQAHRAHLPSMRHDMQEHLQHQDHSVQGLAGFIAKHAPELLSLVADREEAGADADEVFGGLDASGGSDGGLTPADVDRLGFLLQPGRPATRQHPPDFSPMDICAPGPFSRDSATAQLSGVVPLFACSADGRVAASDLASWLQQALLPGGDQNAPAPFGGGDCRMLGTSPPPPPIFNQRIPSLPALTAPSDVVGVHRATAIRGEEELASRRVRVLDCHDAVVYCLAPLQYATVSCCSDCVVVLGAVGRAVRLERCERVQLVAAARSVAVNTCHDCILYLGVNRPPLLLGDNRFVQLAPHNAGYERLPEHMALAGVAPHPNAWDSVTPLLRDRSKPPSPSSHAKSLVAFEPTPSPMQTAPQPPAATAQKGGSVGSAASAAAPAAVESDPFSSPSRQTLPSSLGGSPSGSAAVVGAPPPPGQPPAATLLPPAKLTPFLVPFQGGPGPLCGGAASVRQGLPPAAEPEVAGFMALGNPGAGSFAACPFPLPPEFSAAWEEKMRGAAAVQAAYRAADLEDGRKREFMAAIQAQFKEWLQGSGGMREAYELARLEKEGGGPARGASSDS